jgi:epoxide hydrolase-like predicted phosphatase
VGSYRALVVDWGGVMTTSVSASFAAFCLATGVRPERFKDAVARAYGVGTLDPEPGHAVFEAADGLIPAFETGRIPTEEFARRLAEALSDGLPEPLDPTGLTARMFAELKPDDRMQDALRAAREAGLKTALLSNTWGLDATLERRTDLFDTIVLSGREGLRKPEPEIFRLTAERLDVPPGACVYVDDLPANVEGARAVGMTGVLHRDAAITIPRLEALLEIPL